MSLQADVRNASRVFVTCIGHDDVWECEVSKIGLFRSLPTRDQYTHRTRWTEDGKMEVIVDGSVW